MKILFEPRKTRNRNQLPQLKSGVELIDLGGGRTFVGNLKTHIEISGIPIALLRLMTGRRTTKELSECTSANEDEIKELINILAERNLIDLYPTQIVIENRFHSKLPGRPTSNGGFDDDIALRAFQRRVAPESLVTTFRDGNRDGGKVALSKRQEVSIEIGGDEELSLSLLQSLLSSGFANARLIQEPNRKVVIDDVRAAGISLTDVGSNLADVIGRLKREASLFNSSETDSLKSLVIYFGHPSEPMIQDWLSNSVPHFVIESLGPNFIIGPVVIPGETPCLNCVAYVDPKTLQDLKKIAVFQRPAIGALHLIIGYLTLAISEFIDTEKSPLIGSAKVFDVVNPNLIRDIKYPRHPACGCNWL